MTHNLALNLALTQDPARFGGHSGPELTRYLVVCGLIVLLIAAISFGLRRLVGGAMRRRAASRSLRVLDVLPMGPKQRLSVVQCYDRTFLLGQGEKELTLVAELDSAAVEVPDPMPSRAPLPSRAPISSRAPVAELSSSPAAAQGHTGSAAPASAAAGPAPPGFDRLLAAARARVENEARKLAAERRVEPAGGGASATRLEEVA